MVYLSGNNTFTGINTFSSLDLKTRTKSANYTLGSDDVVIIGNSTSAITFTLPFTEGLGKICYIKNVNTGEVTVQGSGSNTIDGETTQTLSQWDGMCLIDYGLGTWCIV